MYLSPILAPIFAPSRTLTGMMTMGLSWGWLRGMFANLRTTRRKASVRRVTGLEDRTLLAAFVVNTLLDTVDANPGDGLALDANGNTSLRAAVMEANALFGADTITLGAGVHRFSLPEADGEFGDLIAYNGDLDINSPITIVGAGKEVTTIDAALLDRVFDVFDVGALTVQGVTLTGGVALTGGAIRNGGVLIVEDSDIRGNSATQRGGAIDHVDITPKLMRMTLTNVLFEDNRAGTASPTGAVTGAGGAIYIDTGFTTITGCTFVNNVSLEDGGAINSRGAAVAVNDSQFIGNSAVNGGALRLFSGGSMVFNDCTFTGNLATYGGGAIAANSGALNINRGTFDGNRSTWSSSYLATANGGALSLTSTSTSITGVEFLNNQSWRGGAVFAYSSSVTILNSLFQGNAANSSWTGGAVHGDVNAVVTVKNSTLLGNSAGNGGALYGRQGTFNWVNCTVTGNTSFVIGDGDGANGGAVSGGTITNCIIAGNVDNKDLDGAELSAGGNLVGFVINTLTSGDLFGTALTGPIDPQLEPLADHGGPVQTMAIRSTSPARDLGVFASAATATDGRGYPRYGTRPDAGAYEFSPIPTGFQVTTLEDQVLTGQLPVIDLNGATVTYQVGTPTTGTVVLQPGGEFVYTPAANFNGIARFQYRVVDGAGNASPYYFADIEVVAVNDPPVINDQTFTIDEHLIGNNGTFGNVIWSDDGPFPVWWTFISGNEDLRLLFNGSSIRVAKPEVFDFESQSSQTFVLEIRDSAGVIDTAVYTINLNNVIVPKIAPTTLFMNENTPNQSDYYGLSLNSQPERGQVVQFAIENDPSGGAFSVNPTTGRLSIVNGTRLNYEAFPNGFDLQIRTLDAADPSKFVITPVRIQLANVNEAPVVPSQSFTVPEFAANSTVVGRVQATDEDLGQQLTYTISSTSLPGAFAINSTTGDIFVRDASLLDFDLVQSVNLTVQVRDNGSPALITTRTVVVSILDVNFAPVIADQSFTIAEHIGVDIHVATAVATDSDAGQSITYSIDSSSVPGAFSMASNGWIVVADNAQVDFETHPVITLVVRATDNGNPSQFSTATYTFNLTDQNDAPIVTEQSFSVAENAVTGTVVGVVHAYDVDAGNQALTYSLGASQIPGAFAIDPATGVLSVAESSLLDYEALSSIWVVVDVADNGAPVRNSSTTITVQIEDLNDSPVMVEQSFSVDENTFNDEVVGQIVASDQDPGQILRFSLVSSTLPGAFAINPETGAILVSNSQLLNYEQVQSVTLTVSVQDNGNPSLTTTRDFVISIRDVNEPPVVDSHSYDLAEDAQDLQLVGIVQFTDPDLGQTHEVRLTGTNLPGAFSVSASGEIRVADRTLLDYETLNVITLNVEVQDSGFPGWVTTTTMFINLSDRNDAPLITAQAFSISENSLVEARVGYVQASDADAGQVLTYSLVSSDLPGAFAIDAATGELTVADVSLLDFEAIQHAILRVHVQDDGSPNLGAFADITVNILDVNERPRIINQNFTVAENAVSGTVVGTVVSSDVDAGQTRTYAITSSAPISGAFAIDATTGEITVVDGSLLNFEAISAVVLTVTVTDNGNPALSYSAVVVVSLTDVNEAPMIADQSLTVAENTLSTNRIGFVTGSDVDAGQSLTYSIASSTLPGAFAINPVTGEVTVANGSLLNFEAETSATLIVTATDNGSPSLSTSATVTVAITDVNERPTILDQNFTVAENAANGTVVGTVVASDIDAGQSLTYSITQSAPISGAFAINAVTGQITVADGSLLNFEALSAVALAITVTDNGSPNLSHSAVVVVTLTDVNEAPVIANQSFAVAENSLSGTAVGTIIASDVDGGQSLTYSITGSSLAGAFVIHAQTGLITVANAALLNFESVPSVTLTVSVSDSGNPGLSSSAQVTISLTNVNEAPTITNQTFTLVENSANGTTVGNVVGSDVDAGQSLSYSIISGNMNGAFAINAATGRITVANSAALDFETTPGFALTVRVTDNGNPVLSSTATVTVNLTDVIEAIVVGLDVIPGDATNSIKLNGKFDVAILSTATFDARTVNVSTIRFGKNGTEDSITRDKKGNRIYSYVDVNGDGRLDLVVNITNTLTGLGLNDTLAKLSGLTNSGLQILGSSAVRLRR